MALSANASLSIKNTAGMVVETATVATSQTIYKHALVVMKAAGTSCKVAANETTTKFLGIAASQKSAASTATLYTNIWVSIPKRTAVTAGMYGALMYAYDDQYATNLATLGPVIGIHRGIDSANSSNVWVQLGPQTALTSAS